MIFIINDKKYDTEKMQEIAEVKKWYRVDDAFTNMLFQGKEVGRDYLCTLWKSDKGNWLLTHETDYYRNKGEAIDEEEAKTLLSHYALDKYEELFGEIPEA